MGWAQIRLLVDDLGACFAFYRDVMDFRATWGDGTGGYAAFEVAPGEVGLALFDRHEMAESLGTTNLASDQRSQDSVALCFELSAGDLDRRAQEIASRGVRLVTEPMDHPDWGIRTAHLRDPEGNLIELQAALPKEAWDPEMAAVADRES
jgi:predicted enzyme related to lactoylglutathione lyase